MAGDEAHRFRSELPFSQWNQTYCPEAGVALPTELKTSKEAGTGLGASEN